MGDFLSAAAPRAQFTRYLTRSEVACLLGTIRRRRGNIARRDAAMIRIALQSGFRIGSVAGLTVGDAQEGTRVGRLRARAEHAKRGRAYDVPVSRKLRRALKEALAARRAMGFPLDDTAAPLFVSREGTPLSVRAMQHQFRTWRIAAGLSMPASFHWLRHTAAKRVLASTESRDPLGVAQAVLGHANRKSTAIYLLPDREELADAMEAI